MQFIFSYIEFQLYNVEKGERWIKMFERIHTHSQKVRKRNLDIL